jgi:hypothetical protein
VAVTEPAKTAYLHVREAEAVFFPLAIEITGNAKALLQLRKQIDYALEGIHEFLFDETIYRELDGDEYEVVVRRAKSREEMRPPVPRVEEAPERAAGWEEGSRQEASPARGYRKIGLEGQGPQCQSPRSRRYQIAAEGCTR